MRRKAFGLIGLAVLVSCQETGPSGVARVPSVGPVFEISEGRTGGNPDIFFGTPLAENVSPSHPNYDVSHALLQPYMRVCETDGIGCDLDVTQAVTGSVTGLVMSYVSGSEVYSTGPWHTNALEPAKAYRLEIWGLALSSDAEKAGQDPRWLFGWRDIKNSPSVSACTSSQEFCFIKYGQTIPVKARIEESVFCPVTKDCGMQFVSAGTDANLQATFPSGSAAPNAQFFIPAQAGTNFALALEPCTAAEDAAVTNAADFPLFGPCVKTVSKFTGVLSTPAIISLCDDLDTDGFGLEHEQLEQVEVHHFSQDLSRIQALPAALHCSTPTSGQTASAKRKGFLHYARAIRDQLWGWATPKPLFATVSMLDRGGGGEDPFIGSFFKLGLPSMFEYLLASDASQEAKAGDPVVLSAKVVDLTGAPVKGARVRWKAITPPNDGATVLGSIPLAPTLTNASGIAQNTATLNPFRGFNVFHAFGRGIADSRASGCVVPPSTPSSCNGPRATYDPFMPFHVPEFDASGVEAPVEIPVGTRLMFTVFGKGKPAP